MGSGWIDLFTKVVRDAGCLQVFRYPLMVIKHWFEVVTSISEGYVAHFARSVLKGHGHCINTRHTYKNKLAVAQEGM